MKKVMLTALTATLLAGSSAYAGGGGAAGALQAQQNARAAQEAPRRVEGQAREQRGDGAARQSDDRQGGDRQGEGRQGGRPDRAPPAAAAAAAPAAVQPPQAARPGRQGQAPAVAQAQRPQGGLVDRTLQDAQRRAEAQGRGDGRGGRDGDWNNGRGGRDGDGNNGRGGRDGDWNNGRGGRDGDWNNGRGPGNGGRDGNWNGNGNNGRGPDWHRDRRDRDRNRPRYDQRYWPRFVQPSQRYRWYGPSWVGQPGFYYRNWGYGETLPWNWYTPRYYLSDYYRYGLPMPPIGYEWVRVGRDAMLVDVFDGRIYQVVRLLFW